MREFEKNGFAPNLLRANLYLIFAWKIGYIQMKEEGGGDNTCPSPALSPIFFHSTKIMKVVVQANICLFFQITKNANWDKAGDMFVVQININQDVD